MKATKAGLKRFFLENVKKETEFIFKVIDTYYEETGEILTTLNIVDEPIKRTIEEVKSNCVIFSNDSRLYFDSLNMNVDSIEDSEITVSYEPTETTHYNIKYKDKNYETLKKVSKKYLVYKLI